jgi:putative transposase
MARLPRLAIAGYPHHVIQRGNNRQTIFRDVADHQRYLAWLSEIAGQHALAIHAYVLMPNHVHLLATPAAADTLSVVFQALGRLYVRWFNDKYQRTGSLWEGRFRCSVVDSDRYLLTCMRYMDLNPVRAGLVNDPAHFRWSSFAHYAGHRIDPLITDHPLVWSLGNTPFERQSAYRRLFEEPIGATALAAIRYATNRGRVLGPAEFLHGLEGEAAQAFGPPRPKGRPKSQARSARN